ncbi:MAG: cyclase family protein [Armatimonadota bacterium]|nr:cyclase family protein [Armatimonadota bacterium]MDR5702926.1 cyclase family protein [Armatimonadota bacterium]
MCVPQTFEVLGRIPRREFLKLATTSAAAMAISGAGLLTSATPAQARTITYTNIADLTHVLNSAFPRYNPDLFKAFERTNLVTIQKNGFYANNWSLPEHIGTHMDAPQHFVLGRWMLHQIPIRSLIAPAVVIHIHERAAANPDAQVTVDDLKAWENRYGRIPEGAAVLMHSGWESRVGEQNAYRNPDSKGVMHFPGFHPEAAEFLIKERDIVGIGVDTLSLDYGPSSDFKTHITVLGANKWGLENLANLAKIPPNGATIFVGALKVQNASGGPLRVIAVW